MGTPLVKKALPRSLAMLTAMLQWIPSGLRGKGRLARFLIRRGLSATDVELLNRGGDRFLVPQLCEPIAFEMLINGDYEPDTRQFILDLLPEGGVFVDVGANIGVFTIPAARKVGPKGRVLAIEASPRVFPYLERNIVDNGLANVIPIACAAHECDLEDAPFWDAPGEQFGMGSLAPQFHDHPTRIRARTLDRILDEAGLAQVDVVKVDVEGFEASVFRGAKRLLTSSQPPAICFEFCDWAEARAAAAGAAQGVLRDWGFTLHQLDARGATRPLSQIVTSGFAMLVAIHPARRTSAQ